MSRVSVGQPLEIPAGNWNEIQAMLDWWRRQRHTLDRGIKGEKPHPSWVWVHNLSGNDCTLGEALGIDGPVDKLVSDIPGLYLNTELPFSDQIALKGVTPQEEHAGRFVVTLEPIPAGGMGRACIRGACWARLQPEEDDTEGDRAEIEADSRILKVSGSGSAQVEFRPDTDAAGWGIVVLHAPPARVVFTASSAGSFVVTATTGFVETPIDNLSGDNDLNTGAIDNYFSLESNVITVHKTGVYQMLLNGRFQIQNASSQWCRAYLFVRVRENSSESWSAAPQFFERIFLDVYHDSTTVFDSYIRNNRHGVGGFVPLVAGNQMRVELGCMYFGGASAPSVDVSSITLSFTNF